MIKEKKIYTLKRTLSDSASIVSEEEENEKK